MAAVVLRLGTSGRNCCAPFIDWMDLFSMFHAHIIEQLFCIDKGQFGQLAWVAFVDAGRAQRTPRAQRRRKGRREKKKKKDNLVFLQPITHKSRLMDDDVLLIKMLSCN
jgi:hypothetical protein